tara:strand:+ start:699 stop:1355 length:657 start_codon:yes stop_codon:yes gene_type:complete
MSNYTSEVDGRILTISNRYFSYTFDEAMPTMLGRIGLATKGDTRTELVVPRDPTHASYLLLFPTSQEDIQDRSARPKTKLQDSLLFRLTNTAQPLAAIQYHPEAFNAASHLRGVYDGNTHERIRVWIPGTTYPEGAGWYTTEFEWDTEDRQMIELITTGVKPYIDIDALIEDPGKAILNVAEEFEKILAQADLIVPLEAEGPEALEGMVMSNPQLADR